MYMYYNYKGFFEGRKWRTPQMFKYYMASRKLNENETERKKNGKEKPFWRMECLDVTIDVNARIIWKQGAMVKK